MYSLCILFLSLKSPMFPVVITQSCFLSVLVFLQTKDPNQIQHTSRAYWSFIGGLRQLHQAPRHTLCNLYQQKRLIPKTVNLISGLLCRIQWFIYFLFPPLPPFFYFVWVLQCNVTPAEYKKPHPIPSTIKMAHIQQFDY